MTDLVALLPIFAYSYDFPTHQSHKSGLSIHIPFKQPYFT